MVEKISSVDAGYQPGDLSIFPEEIDDKGMLYEAKNNAATKLTQSLSFNAKNIVIEDTSSFPTSGIVRIGPPPGEAGNDELVYYDSKTNTVLKDLVRGFAGTAQTTHPVGSSVSASVMAESHNAVKDAILNIEKFLGTSINPEDGSLNKRLKELEDRFISPKANFQAFPKKGSPPMTVTFQNFSEGNAIRFLWDFGDGTTSIERNPTHTFSTEGNYTIQLSVITTTGSQGISTKNNYIEVSETNNTPFFYISVDEPDDPIYSQETADELVASGDDLNAVPTQINFVDQTDGDIAQRFWVFDDGSKKIVTDPDEHSTSHIYDTPGTYSPSLLIVFASQKLARVFLSNEIVIL